MHILVVHNRYRSGIPSGENAVVDDEIAGLRASGHQVTAYLRSSDELAGMNVSEKARSIMSPIHSGRAVRDIARIVAMRKPDILHLHNPYPLISMSVVTTARRLGVPCVQTVHNHRHTCMKGTYQRNGRVCRDCLAAGHPGPGVIHGCYRGSRAQSAVMAAALLRGRRALPEINRFIALTPEIETSLAEAGIDPSKISLKPNSVPDPGPPAPLGDGFLFVGRLSHEKGVVALLEAWRRHGVGQLGRLRVVGDGPAAEEVRLLAADRPDLEIAGRLDRAGVRKALDDSAVLVVPSLWPEAFPLVLLEAMAAGRPLLVTDQGGLPRVVQPELGTVVAADVDGIAGGLERMSDRDHLVAMGAEARRRYEDMYHPSAVINALVDIYEHVVAEAS